MKIPYNLNGKYVKCYNEANGICLLKNKLKKNPNIKIKNYISYITLQYALYIILFCVAGAICINEGLQFMAQLFIIFGAIILLIYMILILIFFIMVFNKKLNSSEGILEINEEGIFDKSKNGIQMGFSYQRIELIVITDHLIVFLTNIPIMIMINNDDLDKNKIINKIKKNSDVQIIDKTNN